MMQSWVLCALTFCISFSFLSFFWEREKQTDTETQLLSLVHSAKASRSGSRHRKLQTWSRFPTCGRDPMTLVIPSTSQAHPGRKLEPWTQRGTEAVFCVRRGAWGVGRGHLNQQAKCLLLPVLLTLTSQNHNEQHMSTTDMTEQCSTNNRPPSLSGWKKLMLTKRDIYI